MASLSTFLVLIILLIGLALVVFGSDFLVDGSSEIARRSGISEFVIGMTIVGIGTSTPEMVVSFLSAIRGNADIAVGNIVGSNIFNTCLILGVTALILPVSMTRQNIKRDIPICIIVTLLFILMGYTKSVLNIASDSLSRIDGIVMLMLFAGYMVLCFKNKDTDHQEDVNNTTHKHNHVIVPILLVVGGLAALIGGGNLFVDSAVELAKRAGWSDKFIGITILAFGTSLPELATCVVAGIKKKGQLALGNILGSNVANILLILGGSALICPLSLTNITGIDMGTLILSTLFILASYFSFDKRKLDRSEGCILIIIFITYMVLLIKGI